MLKIKTVCSNIIAVFPLDLQRKGVADICPVCIIQPPLSLLDMWMSIAGKAVLGHSAFGGAPVFIVCILHSYLIPNVYG